MARSMNVMSGTDDARATRTSYPKSGAGDSDSKQETMREDSGMRASGGGMSGEMSGPTGSKRMYYKGTGTMKMPPLNGEKLNVMNWPTTDLYVGGVNPATGKDDDEGMTGMDRKMGDRY